jgi:PTH2 family peptidyl-tRNA hydrolase
VATDFTMKQVIVVRKDLPMDVGKLVSQACHACLEASEEAKKRDVKGWHTWRREGAKKVVVKVGSVEDLFALEKQAGRLNLPKALIVDRGLTQIPPNTPTALGIGPGRASIIDAVTGDLKLL